MDTQSEKLIFPLEPLNSTLHTIKYGKCHTVWKELTLQYPTFKAG